MPPFDPTAADSSPTFWEAVPVDLPPTRRADPAGPGDAYAAFLAATEDHPVAPYLSVERTDVG